MTRWMIGMLDAQVAAAHARGAFNNLAGHGRPLDLDDLAGLDGEPRFDALLLRSLGKVAPEVTRIRDVRAKRTRIEETREGPERVALVTALETQVAELAVALRARRSG